MLDHFSAGVALLDRKLNVQFANRALRAMANDGALALRGRTLSSSSPSHARKLDRMTRSALLGAPDGTMAIPHPHDGRLITVLVTATRNREFDSYAAPALADSAAIVFSFDPARPSALPPAWLMDAYDLTMAEAQVALQASLGRSVSAIGLRLKISPNTVKTHLRHVFAKTGVHGQVELVGLIAALRAVRGDGEN
ncbi:PAS domain-containing protein [Bradyrhizobium genosp. L]|uniref:helix-turn-helix transcriptional regulator n=1 Tax=Bradyrhizobium genosp. L TaxID=83637 RepID=UPI0018A31E33|nr:LuxR C-terminal-related transcriptional regulator [Bradyrhizobium genosp. L]QPF84082.1 PAS domain-containing protein [Bradyrhizobium genosp. L]